MLMGVTKQQSLFDYSLSMRQTAKLDSIDYEKMQQIRNYLHINKPVRISARRFVKKVFENTDYFVCIFKKTSAKTGFNELLGLRKEVFTVIDRYEDEKDVYISYSSYVSKKGVTDSEGKIKKRTIGNIRHTVCFVQDLDYYKLDMTEEQALEILSHLIEARELEMPHIILFTGRGIQLLWLIDNVYMKQNSKSHKAWESVQQYNMNVLKDLQPDSVVKSPSAITRLPNSINSRNGEQVRAYILRDDRLTLGHFLENYDLFPAPDRKVQKRKHPGKVVHSTKLWNAFTLNRERENDVFRLVQYKQSHGENLIGIRQHLALVLRFHALVSSNGDYDYAEQRVLELWDTIQQQEDTNLKEILRRSQQAERYYKEWVGELAWRGEGKYKQPGLFYKNRTLIDFWDISKECQIQLKTIKVRDKEYERLKSELYRRKNGVTDRESYLAGEQEKKQDKLWQLEQALDRHPEATQTELAIYLGWNQSTVSRYMKKLK